MCFKAPRQRTRSSEFLRGHYDHTENTALLEVLPWKQDIKRKFLSPFSRSFKACAENPVALSPSEVTSVWSRLFLLKNATQGGCCVCLQVIQSCRLTTHRRDAQFIGAFKVSDKHILQTRRWEVRESDQLLVFSGYALEPPVCSGGHPDHCATQPWSCHH